MSLFEKIGLDAKAAAKVKGEVGATLTEIINEAGIADSGCEKAVGTLLHHTATKFPGKKFPPHPSKRPKFVEYIMNKKITTILQFDEGVKYLNTLGMDSEVDWAVFEKEAGVGATYSDAEIDDAVNKAFAALANEITKQRYRINLGLLFSKAMPHVKFANGQLVKSKLEAKLAETLGPKTAEDEAPLEKKKKEKKPVAKEGGKKDEGASGAAKEELKGAVKHFPLPHENNKRNAKDILDRHLKTTGGRVITRFPPEPNGFLHIGHAKAINQNFGYARKHNGGCILRYDDTNPEKEEVEYYDSIRRNVEWLTGHPPVAVTYSADYFEQLYELAIKLIKRGKAFVCHQTSADMKASREKREPSPWRDRPIEENLRLFEEMRRGKYGEGEISLRMKMDYKSNNPCMWDHVAYRVKHTEHVRAGDKWCIYPSYDFTHCIVDSLENVTHSMCTLEFLPRQESYFWLLEALDMYQPVVWEYSRLAITNSVLSKRKLLYLVKNNVVSGWDDPRLLTLDGLRRRGYTPAAINNLCDLVGVTTKDSSMIEMAQLESCVRADLDENAPRAWAVSEPLKLVMKNFEACFGKEKTVDIPNHPKNPERGSHKAVCGDTIYIDMCDFRLEDSKDFFGLAPNKEVGLKGLGNFMCTDVDRDSTGKVLCVYGTLDVERKNKTKGHLQWVSAAPGSQPHQVELRLYDKLFMSKDPTELGDDWLNDVNPDSIQVVKGAMGDNSIKDMNIGDTMQLERIGFFCKDPDSTPECTVLNRTVTLRESTSKKAATKGSDKPDPRKGKAQPAADDNRTPLARICMRVGQIKKVWRHPDADSLYCEEIDIGEDAPRLICSGLVKHIPIEQMMDRRVIVMSNLKPASMRGVKSAGMVMCASNGEGDNEKVNFISPPEGAKVGERISFEGHPGEADPELNPRKKYVEQVLPDFCAKDGIAYYKDVPFMTSAGPCTSTIAGKIR